MARIVSFVVLVSILLLIGFLFFEVMAPFLLPLFMAIVMAVIFRPLHEWVLTKCHGWTRLAGITTTAIILVIALLPSTWLAVRVTREGASIVRDLKPEDLTNEFGKAIAKVREFAEQFGIEVVSEHEMAEYATAKLRDLSGPAALGGIQYAFQFMFGFFIMVIALYYFLVDGPDMMAEVMRLFPLEPRYSRQLVQQFGNVSRAVVIATLLAAVVQGILAGVAFAIAGIPMAFLLTGLTTFMAMIPFVGATVVWVPCCLWLFFHQDRPVAAVMLALYCIFVVSLVDNLIKPLVLHGHSNLHPLLALLSVLGGVSTLGPIGILVGPLAVSFLQALLVMLRTEIDAMAADETKKV